MNTLQLSEQCFLGRSLDEVVLVVGGNVPMCCDATSCRVHKMYYSFIKNSGTAAEQIHLLSMSFCPRWTRNSKYQCTNMDAMRA